MTHHDPEIKQIPENPYATPAVQPPLVAPMGAATEFSHLIFQKDGLLIVHKKATLPDRCLKSNEPTQSRLKRSLYWHHPALYLLILLHIVIYAIVAIIIRKSAVFWIPLSRSKKEAASRYGYCLVLGLTWNWNIHTWNRGRRWKFHGWSHMPLIKSLLDFGWRFVWYFSLPHRLCKAN